VTYLKVVLRNLCGTTAGKSKNVRFIFEVTNIFCVMCVVCVLCLIVVPLPPGENPFSVKINI
jgi:hypothetical protein